VPECSACARRHTADIWNRGAERQNFRGDVECKFTKTQNGYVYETAIPSRYLLPARLEANYSMGFALFLNDRDNDKNAKCALTLTPEGTGLITDRTYTP
jgi:hypothetical protein